MNKSILCSTLDDLFMPTQGQKLNDFFERKFVDICEKLGTTYQEIIYYLGDSVEGYFSNPDIVEWKYLLVALFTLKKLGETGEILSVKENKNLKANITHLTRIGISTKLQSNLPLFLNEKYTETDDIFYEYNVLKSIVFTLCKLIEYPCLRITILTQSLRTMLVALYQISYCPLKMSNPQFTHDIRQRLENEWKLGANILKKLKEDIHPAIYVKESMTLVEPTSPVWFKREVFQMLTNIMYGQNGLENISVAMLDGNLNDKTKTWKALDIICRLVLSCKSKPDFKNNIGQQLLALLNKSNNSTLIYERVFIGCVKAIYYEDQQLGDYFLKRILDKFIYFTNMEYKFPEGNLTVTIQQNIRLIHSIFVEKSVESKDLPIEILTPVLDVVFRFYCLTLDSVFKIQMNETKEVLLKYFRENREYLFKIFDGLVFRFHRFTLPFRNDILLQIEGDSILLSYPEYSVVYSIPENMHNLLRLIESDADVLYKFFGYLLNCVVNKAKYFKKVKEETLVLDEKSLESVFEQNFVIYKMLSDLSENKAVQKKLVECPKDIIIFIESILQKSIEEKIYKSDQQTSDDFQSLFIVVMVVQALVSNKSSRNIEEYKQLIRHLQVISDGTDCGELSELINNILTSFKKGTSFSVKDSVPKEKTKFDQAMSDISDPLLPVRGHGLMELKKLIEQKDSEVLKRTHYILNIFQHHLKDKDSFIYLTAIDGLAGMTNIFPDIVLFTLCEEYSEFSRKDDEGHEVIIKLGEVLVRVIKLLGEMAPKYKALLLNTFLNVTKHEDHLVRASSLSNLGEVCRVLGYKLGTVVTEVLVCVHSIIATDKAIEARRAAVTVLRQLLAGLESDFIAFLKEEILPIYRTLKNIYQNDRDDIMRLQAQLALEELDANMRTFLFSEPLLSLEKNMIKLT